MLILSFLGEVVSKAATAFKRFRYYTIFAHSLAHLLESFYVHLMLRGGEVGKGCTSVQQETISAVYTFIQQIDPFVFNGCDVADTEMGSLLRTDYCIVLVIDGRFAYFKDTTIHSQTN